MVQSGKVAPLFVFGRLSVKIQPVAMIRIYPDLKIG